MPINLPTFRELVDRSRAGVRSDLPESDPTVFGSFIRAIVDSLASRSYDLVLLIEQVLKQAFPQTANLEFLQRWAGYEGLSLNAASNASGFVVIEGVSGTAIPVNSLLVSSSGLTYTTQAGVSISSNSFSVVSIERSGGVATVVAVGHPLASGVTVTVSGADQAEYNGEFEVSVVDSDTFTYEVTGSPASPATGSIYVGIDSARVLIESELAGQDQNLSGGAVLSLTSGGDAFAQFEGIVGGTDIEDVEEFRARTIESRSNPVANFNAFAIEKQAKTVSGVTRVFVRPITPNIGDVTVYFLRDNDSNPIPSSSEINAVNERILELLPATSDASNIYVLPPAIIPIDFTFTSISPDTPSMRDSVTNSLLAFFEDRAEFETGITVDQYRSAIIETQDTETGVFLDSFVLSVPVGDIAIADGEIAALGNVVYL